MQCGYIFLLALVCEFVQLGSTTIPWTKQQSGQIRYSSQSGQGACGYSIDGLNDDFASISSEWFTNSVPANDEFCKPNVCVQVNAGRIQLTVRALDVCSSAKCPGKTDLVLSQSAFGKLFGNIGKINTNWAFIKCTGA